MLEGGMWRAALATKTALLGLSIAAALTSSAHAAPLLSADFVYPLHETLTASTCPSCYHFPFANTDAEIVVNAGIVRVQLWDIVDGFLASSVIHPQSNGWLITFNDTNFEIALVSSISGFLLVNNNGRAIDGQVGVELIGGCCTGISADLTGAHTRFFDDSVGEYYDTWTAAPGRWSTTPLPSALPLLVGGLGALGLFGWRRNRAPGNW